MPRPTWIRPSLLCIAAASLCASAARAQTAVAFDRLRQFTGVTPRPDIVVADVSNFRQNPVTRVSNYWPGGPRQPINPIFTFPDGSSPPTEQNHPRYNPTFGDGFEGVARLEIKDAQGEVQFGCSGALISSRQILTAAHCVSLDDQTIFAGGVDATFLGPGGGTRTISSTGIHVMPGYTGSVVDTRDLAIIDLSQAADPWIPRYPIFTGNPLFEPVFQAGYGLSGNGITGGVINTEFDETPVLRVALNRWELTADETFIYAGGAPGGAILLGDFDGGNGAVLRFPLTRQLHAVGTREQNNTICNFTAAAFDGIDPSLLDAICYEDFGLGTPPQIGYGLFEGLIDSGDSGSPAFVVRNGQLQLAGVASFGDFTCVPDQRLDRETGEFDPRTDDFCLASGFPEGYIAVGALFGFTSGHVLAGADEQLAFIRASAVPEPATAALLAAALIPLAVVARRRAKR